MKNIVLIGLPGSGKTTLAKELAKKLNREFIDLDDLIEKKSGTSITDIFAKLGEPVFREMETQAVHEVANREDIIIAAGGGTVLKEENMDLLCKNGIIVFLNRSPESIIKDIHADSRPLLKDDKEKLFTLHKERLALYQKYNDIEIVSDNTISQTLSRLEKIAALDAGIEKKFAVIGTPIDHSLSPNIHLPLLKRFYNDVRYTKVEIAKNELPPWLKYVRQENVSGFNITMPHKEDIIPFLDHIDDEALKLHSVNTVINNNGILTGYNTDGGGFKLALATKGEDFINRHLVIIGSGGAAGTLALKAAKDGAKKLTILAIDEEKSNIIIKKAVQLNNAINAEYHSLTPHHLLQYCEGADILINATPLGMTGIKEDFTDFTFLETLKPTSLVCDLIYSPAHTNLLLEAKKLGLNTLGGIQMLIYQAILADNLFLGLEQNMAKAYAIVIKHLKGRVDL